MKRALLSIFAILTLAGLACSPGVNVNVNVPKVTTGPTETVTVNVPAPAAGVTADVHLRMGAGKLALSGGSEGLASGSIQYNVADWKPMVTSGDGSLTIEQSKNGQPAGLPGKDVVNDWDLKLGRAPMNLTLEAGAYDGTLNLTGLHLRGLTISDGASQSSVVFDDVNPEPMGTLSYSTGASHVTLTGLANANFETMTFDGGAGTYELDFSGRLQRDAKVTVEGGVSSTRIVVPAGTNVVVSVNGGLNNVKTEGGWTKGTNRYSLTGSGPALSIDVTIGLGQLTLVTK